MSNRMTPEYIDRCIARTKKELKQEFKGYFKRLLRALAIIALIFAAAFPLVHRVTYTEENTAVITGKCVSIHHTKTSIPGSGSGHHFRFQLDNGEQYTINKFGLSPDEAEETFTGKEITIRVSAKGGSKILELSDNTRVYYSLEDENHKNRTNFVAIFAMIGVISTIFLLFQLALTSPLGTLRELFVWRKQKKELTAQRQRSESENCEK